VILALLANKALQLTARQHASQIAFSIQVGWLIARRS
jgi:hypothetical protein